LRRFRIYPKFHKCKHIVITKTELPPISMLIRNHYSCSEYGDLAEEGRVSGGKNSD
jgi:hypothetical protein